MGSYSYYDANFTEDLSAELHVHDCMWSGECFACQSARITFSTTSVIPVSNGTIPVTVGGGLHTLKHGSVSEDKSLSENGSPSENECLSEKEYEPEKEFRVEKEYRPEKKPRAGKKCRAEKRCPSERKYASDIKCPSENKKLRHREVEKNRHRQLQAMVKTLSDKIPGKLDKETQVQTMKRAARYCLYLREVLNLLAVGQEPPNLRAKLESIYTTSCDNVELIMSQSGSKK